MGVIGSCPICTRVVDLSALEDWVTSARSEGSLEDIDTTSPSMAPGLLVTTSSAQDPSTAANDICAKGPLGTASFIVA
jgi:hypothetical protein